MIRFLVCFSLLFCALNLSAQKIFVVRHAEKAVADPTMSSDVPLSEKGKQRAEALKELLAKENIQVIYSTNTTRTKTTGQPTADLFGITIQTYGPRPDSAFAATVRASGKNVLIIAHSNTIDEAVNLLMGETKVSGDLDEKEYNNLFVITKDGDKLDFERRNYGSD
jgi:broad specificity phosphatase PhoE